jgi:hypothetical protein
MQAKLAVMATPHASVSLRYPVRPKPDAWILPEGPVPQSTSHATAVYHLHSVLLAWEKRVGTVRPLRIAYDLAVRWLEQHPRTGIDPDLCVLEPAPPDFEDLSSLRLWEPGRVPPRLAIEIVSASHPHKDYAEIHERYAAMGVEELVVFDGLLVGPRSMGGPVTLQLWRRDPLYAFERVHFADEPVYSHVLDAWFVPDGRLLQIADDRRGHLRWLTDAERAQADAAHAQADAERAQADAERAQADAERAQADAERERVIAERATADAKRAQWETERIRAEIEHERAAREELEKRLRELEAAVK